MPRTSCSLSIFSLSSVFWALFQRRECGVQVYLHVISLEGTIKYHHLWDPESKCIHNSQLQPHLAKTEERTTQASSRKLPVPAIPSAPPCVIAPSPRVLFLLNMSPENFTCFTFTWSQSQHGQNGSIFSPTKTWLTDAEDQPSTPASRFVSKRSCSFFAALMTDVGRLRSDPTLLQLLSVLKLWFSLKLLTCSKKMAYYHHPTPV